MVAHIRAGHKLQKENRSLLKELRLGKPEGRRQVKPLKMVGQHQKGYESLGGYKGEGSMSKRDGEELLAWLNLFMSIDYQSIR